MPDFQDASIEKVENYYLVLVAIEVPHLKPMSSTFTTLFNAPELSQPAASLSSLNLYTEQLARVCRAQDKTGGSVEHHQSVQSQHRRVLPCLCIYSIVCTRIALEAHLFHTAKTEISARREYEKEQQGSEEYDSDDSDSDSVEDSIKGDVLSDIMQNEKNEKGKQDEMRIVAQVTASNLRN